MNTKNTKPFYQSKMLWFNALAVLLLIANSLGYANFSPDPDLMAVAIAVINFLLRFITTKAINTKG